MANKSFLDSAYELEDLESTRAFYADWAETYDAEVKSNGYVTPQRCAKALSEAVSDLAAPLLDIGCGTGLSGIALRDAGFTTVDGTDLSQEMIDIATHRGDIYRELFLGLARDPLPIPAGEYVNAAAIGVFSPGHAPPETMDTVMGFLPRGGCFVFSMNDHALEDPSYVAKIEQVVADRVVEQVFREHGPHLPGIGLQSTVVVLRKL
ncbi:MAG: methyltransferase domain-containing protein [Pseudomonadota bacterium]